MHLDSIQIYWHSTVDASKDHFQTEMFDESNFKSTFWKNDLLAYFCTQCFKGKKGHLSLRTTETDLFVTFSYCGKYFGASGQLFKRGFVKISRKIGMLFFIFSSHFRANYD